MSHVNGVARRYAEDTPAESIQRHLPFVGVSVDAEPGAKTTTSVKVPPTSTPIQCMLVSPDGPVSLAPPPVGRKRGRVHPLTTRPPRRRMRDASGVVDRHEARTVPFGGRKAMAMTMTIERVMAFMGLDVLVARDEGLFEAEGLDLRIAALPPDEIQSAAEGTPSKPTTNQGKLQARGEAQMFQA